MVELGYGGEKLTELGKKHVKNKKLHIFMIWWNDVEFYAVDTVEWYSATSLVLPIDIASKLWHEKLFTGCSSCRWHIQIDNVHFSMDSST